PKLRTLPPPRGEGHGEGEGVHGIAWSSVSGSGIGSGPYQANEKESIMKAAAPLQLREAGQSLWLDNITRDLLTSGTLKRYIDELSITGLTSNPTIFDHAITKGQAYDAAIRQNIRQDQSDEELFCGLAV